MRAMLLESPRQPLRPVDLPIPTPGATQLLLKIQACGVCRTDLHVLDGDLDQPKLPLILGHEIVGRVVKTGDQVSGFRIGKRVGVPWLGHTCGTCRYCQSGQENLCDHPGFTGYTLDGGYAEYTVAEMAYCFPLPEQGTDAEMAPLLCAGLIGYRSFRMAGEDAQHLGLYGFGAAAHIIAQVAIQQGRQVYAFTSPGDIARQDFARQLGTTWAGGSDEQPPSELDAAILFAPVGALVPAALRAVHKGGVVVCAGIHMSDIPSFPYHLLWEERIIRSVANLTRRDAEEFFQVISRYPVHTEVQTFPLQEANQALDRLRRGQVTGAAVLIP